MPTNRFNVALWAGTLLTALTCHPAFAQFGDMGNLLTKPCDGRVQKISGMGNAVKLTGYCPSVIVSGSGNTVIVERVGQIIVSGSGHDVSYVKLNPDSKVKGKFVHPAKSVSGLGNTIEWTRGKMPKLQDEDGPEKTDN